jgi:drug/metabolite transporter (DMT)-like permease
MNSNRGIANALLAALLFGASTPLAKLALSSTSPLLVAGLLYLGSGCGLAILRLILAASGRRRVETPLSPADLPWLLAAILAGGVLAPALLLWGLLTTSASAAALLLNLEVVCTAVIAWVVFRENVDRRVGTGFACILLGGVLLSLPQGGMAISSGALLIAAACLCWGIDNNITRQISGSDPLQIAMWKGLVAGIVNSSLALTIGATVPDVSMLVGVAIVGFFGYGLSLVLFVGALRHLGTARTAAYFSTAPFVGAALAFAIGQGGFDWAFCAAGVLMLAGVWLHVTECHEHLHVHEPMEHEHLHFHDEHHQHEHSLGDPLGEPHVHCHKHPSLVHSHRHYPDTHHRHEH